jgi:transcriptional regulator with XRE-family HTH domain
MTTADMPKKIHEGRNIKRFREMLGIKQETLASELGEDWTQSKISHLESKETIDPAILEQVSRALKVPADAIRNFDEDATFNIMANTYHDSSASVHYSFNPLDKIIELYERMLKEKDELIEKLTETKSDLYESSYKYAHTR